SPAVLSWLSTSRKELSRTLGISGRRHGISRCSLRKKTSPSIPLGCATAGVSLTPMANGLRFPAADSAGRPTRGQVGRPTLLACGNCTRDSAGRGFPANPGAGCPTTAAYGTTTLALAGIGWTRCSDADSGELRWSIGIPDQDGSAGRRRGAPAFL